MRAAAPAEPAAPPAPPPTPTAPPPTAPAAPPPTPTLPSGFGATAAETPPGAERPLTALSIGGRPGDVDFRPVSTLRWVMVAAGNALAVALAIGAAITLLGP